MSYKYYSLKLVALIIFCGFCLQGIHAQTCTTVKDGTFYSYPKNSTNKYHIERSGDMEKETDIVSGDTSMWKVKWLNDCTYSATYISGSAKLTESAETFTKQHSLVTKIESVTPEYYTYYMYIDKVAGKYLMADTIWAQQKLVATNNTLFQLVPDNTSPKKLNFNSKSPFALLYVYRPKKLMGSKGDYLLYMDNNILCAAKNNTGYVFKVFKEGTFKLTGKQEAGKEITTEVPIKFGQKVYVKAALKFVATTLSGWRPDIVVVDAEVGSDEFSAIDMP